MRLVLVGMVLSALAGMLVGLSACGKEEPPPKTAEEPEDLAFLRLKPTIVEGLAQPDSAVHDEQQDVYLVTNINGDPFDEKADNGFISRVSPDGEVLDLKWIDGEKGQFTLNAPKGIALTKDRIYVADIDSVRMFRRKNGSPIGRFKVPQATDLNAITADDQGSVYVSNSGLERGEKGLEPTGKDSVYRLTRRGSLKKLARGEDLNQPSGLATDKKGVWVVTRNAKQLFHISKWGKREDPVELPHEGMEGLLRLNDGRLLVSVPEKNVILSGWPGSQFKPALDQIDAPAGIGYDFQRAAVLVPQPDKNRLLVQPLGEL